MSLHDRSNQVVAAVVLGTADETARAVVLTCFEKLPVL
jgi:hypothetical protein